MKLEIQNVRTKLIPETDGDRGLIHDLSNKYKVFIPEAIYTRQYQLFKATGGARGWDGRASMIDMKSLSVPSGMIPSIIQDVQCRIEDQRQVPLVNVDINQISVPLRDYQLDVVRNSIFNSTSGTWWPRGVWHVATGGGKTEIAVAMLQAVPAVTLFVVHRKDLLVQTAERFSKYGIQVGIMGAGKWAPNSRINVATIQTLHSTLKGNDKHKKLLLEGWLPLVEQVFFDEAHMLASNLQNFNTFIAMAERIPAFFRWGLTATPFMRDKYSNWLLEGATGPVLQTVKSATLIANGHLTEPEIIFQHIYQPTKCPNTWPDGYISGIVLNQIRHRSILEWATKLPHPTLVIVKDLVHLKSLAKLAKADNLSFNLVEGVTPLDQRQQSIKDLRSGLIDIIFCSSIFDEGIDLPELRTLINGAGGKSVTKTLQRLGRLLRTSAGKTDAYFIDFYDHTCRMLKRHSEQRMATYKSEGYKIKEVR